MASDYQNFLDALKDQDGGNSIGKMIASGIGVGLSKHSYLAITALENVYVELETLTKNAAKNAEKYTKALRERQLKNLKNSLELEFISEQEYYEKLKKYRDENLREGTDSWYKYTEEIIKYNKRLMEEAEKEQQRLLQKTEELRQGIEKNLLSGDKDWYSSGTVTFYGTGENGRKEVFRRNSLENFEEEIDLLQRYRNIMQELEKLGTVPEGILTEIANMEVTEAIRAAGVLLMADEKALENFADGYNRLKSLAKEVSAEANGILNKEALRELGIASLESFDKGYSAGTAENKEFITIIEKAFSSVPESYYELGTSSGEQFGEGFLTRIEVVMEEARLFMLDSMRGIVSELGVVVSGAESLGGAGVSNVFNTSYTFNSSKDTTTQQLMTARAAADMEKLRKGGE